MNTAELNFNALLAASTALLGAEKTQMLSELYVLLDNAEKIGEASGMENCNKASYDLGYEQGYTTGSRGAADHGDARYHEGFNDGIKHAHEDNEVSDAYIDDYQVGWDCGYNYALNELGECPTVDQEWDCDEEGYLRHAVHTMID